MVKNISLSTTPTPHYRMVSDGSNWLVYGVGDSVRLSGVQTISGAKTFSATTKLATVNATALQVNGTDIGSTYATLATAQPISFLFYPSAAAAQ